MKSDEGDNNINKKELNQLAEFLQNYRKEIHNSAASLLQQKMPPLTEELFALFEQTGNRLEYEQVYFTRRKFLAILGLEVILQERECRIKHTELTKTIGIELERKDGAGDRTTCRLGVESDGILAQLEEVIDSVCEEETWALPAHVNRKENPDWRITVDLFAAETAQTLSELADRLYNVLPQCLIRKITEEVSRRVLRPFFRSEAPYSWWEGSDMNWNGVCVGAIGSACLHLYHRGMELPVHLSDALARINTSLQRYLAGFTNDGACMEGLGYYTYGMTYFMNYIQELQTCVEQKHRFFAKQEFQLPSHFAAIAEFLQKCFFSDGRTVSFSDGDSRDTWRVGLLVMLRLCDKNVYFPKIECAASVHTDSCYRFVALKLDVLATEEYLQSAKTNLWEQEVDLPPIEARSIKLQSEKPVDVNIVYKKRLTDDGKEGPVFIFPDAQWCIAESRNHIGFACKGGHNNEPHNHNDVGHFIYESDSILFLTDLGAGEYTADYFGTNRYQIFCNSSAGHSVPIINGGYQKQGEQFRCGNFFVEVQEDTTENKIPVHTKIGINVSENNASAKVMTNKVVQIQMEIGSAYIKAACERTLRFHLDNGMLEVEDTFDRSQDISVTENLVTQIRPHICNNRIFLEKNGHTVIIEILNESNCEASQQESPYRKSEKEAADKDCEDPESLRVIRQTHRNHQGKDENVYAIQWDVKHEKAQYRIYTFS